jgi:hypothetical protein
MGIEPCPFCGTLEAVYRNQGDRHTCVRTSSDESGMQPQDARPEDEESGGDSG